MLWPENGDHLSSKRTRSPKRSVDLYQWFSSYFVDRFMTKTHCVTLGSSHYMSFQKANDNDTPVLGKKQKAAVMNV